LEVCGVAFILSVLVCLLSQTAWPLVIGAPCWLVAYCIDKHAKRIYDAEFKRYRQHNASQYFDVFSVPPLDDINSVSGNYVELFDLKSFDYLGIVEKSDIIAILDTYQETPEMLPCGSNDIPFSHIDLMYFRDCKPDLLSKSFTNLINSVTDADNRVELTLRWVEPRGSA
jgi:hypothetical protein